MSADAFALAIVAVVGTLVGLFREPLRDWWLEPKLRVRIESRPPYIHKTTDVWVPPGMSLRTLPLEGRESADVYYIRLEVSTNRRAHDLEVLVTRVERRNDHHAFVPLDSWNTSLPLVWTHLKPPQQTVLPRVSKDAPRLVDLALVYEPPYRKKLSQLGDDTENRSDLRAGAPALSLCVTPKPTTKEYLLSPGAYRLTCVLAGANTQDLTFTVEIELGATWYSDPTEMIRHHLTASLV